MAKRVKFNNVIYFKTFDKTLPSIYLNTEFLQFLPKLKARLVAFRKSPASKTKSKIQR